MFYWYYDNATGEEFFVESDNQYQANATAREFFESPDLLATVDAETVERYGYDVY